MKILLDINDNKAAFFLELIKNFSFIKKATPISNEKSELMEDIREGVKELKQVKEGNLVARDVQNLIDEL